MSLEIRDIVFDKTKKTKKAALYYKTEPFFVNVDNYTHTNNWEILQSIKILNHKGFSVDLIDRRNSNWKPESKYDIFLGLGVGNSGRNFAKHAIISGAPRKILLAMGPQPDTSNKRTLKRYEMFKERTGYSAPPMRTVEDVVGEKFLDIIEATDFIFAIGEEGTPSYNSFLKYDKPVLNFLPSTSSSVKFDNTYLQTRKNNSFLCFAGNGFICKGVDLVVEAFLRTPEKELHICGPSSEKSFFNYYGSKISKSPNIKYHGFIKPGGDIFNKLAATCSYVIFHSSSEGCCTSVATSIKAGIVPIINSWTGILVENEINGFTLNEKGDIISDIIDTCEAASNITTEKYNTLVNGVIKKSKLFSQESFTQSYSKALDIVLQKQG